MQPPSTKNIQEIQDISEEEVERDTIHDVETKYSIISISHELSALFAPRGSVSSLNSTSSTPDIRRQCFGVVHLTLTVVRHETGHVAAGRRVDKFVRTSLDRDRD